MSLPSVGYHDLFIPIRSKRRKPIMGIDVIAEPELVVGVH